MMKFANCVIYFLVAGSWRRNECKNPRNYRIASALPYLRPRNRIFTKTGELRAKATLHVVSILMI
jgi:hypothetical protein